jgi:Fis family transcriptional regulator, factor for inversion stimulation protein
MKRKETALSVCIRKTLSVYFDQLDGEKPTALYDLVIKNVERPLLEVVLEYAQGNQTKAAEALGVNRNTLRKKMQECGLR